jgi:hypothetical protein
MVINVGVTVLAMCRTVYLEIDEIEVPYNNPWKLHSLIHSSIPLRSTIIYEIAKRTGSTFEATSHVSSTDRTAPAHARPAYPGSASSTTCAGRRHGVIHTDKLQHNMV